MRAPQMMKVTISFSPIHDIPMGLDSDGMMRSVAYNVGQASGLIGHDPLGPDVAAAAIAKGEAEAKGKEYKKSGKSAKELEDEAKAGLDKPGFG